ncbi:MAG: transposase domain-containing protein [Verrucomicrobiota bacterium]
MGIASSALGGWLRRPGTLIACGPVNGEYTTEAAWRSAEIHSLRITARRAGSDPAKWLEDVLRRIPTATTANLHELLPGNGNPATA